MDLITAGDFSISITSIAFLMFSVFLIAAVGYLLGRITIKGVSLGTAGVFIVALLYGCFFFDNLSENESLVYMAVTDNYEGYMLFFFKNGKAAKVYLS